jgi:hypothetical protein
MNTNHDRAHIEAAIGHYFQGHATGDAAHFHKGAVTFTDLFILSKVEGV